MYPFLKTLAAHLIMPLPITFALLALGGLLYWGRYQQAGVVAFGLGVVLLFLASWGPVAERLLAPLETRYLPIHSLADEQLLVGGASVDAIVVLGGGWQPSAPTPAHRN